MRFGSEAVGRERRRRHDDGEKPHERSCKGRGVPASPTAEKGQIKTTGGAVPSPVLNGQKPPLKNWRRADSPTEVQAERRRSVLIGGGLDAKDDRTKGRERVK